MKGATEQAPQGASRALSGVVPGIVLGGAFLALLWTSVDMAQVSALMARASWPPLVLALVAYAVDFVLRAWRFWHLLQPGEGHRGTFRASIAPFIASFGISDILPLRLGDVYRVHWFHSRQGFPMGRVIGAMIVERVLDLVAILLVAAGALVMVRTGLSGGAVRTLSLVLALAIAGCAGVLLLPAVVEAAATWIEARSARPIVQRIVAGVRSVTQALRAIGTPRRMAGMLLVSAALWLLESLVMLGAWVSLGGDLADWLQPLFAFAFSTLGTLVPGLPGHFGSYDAAGVVSFAAFGLPAERATAVVLLAHLLLWLPTALFGVGWLVAAKRGRRPEPAPA